METRNSPISFMKSSPNKTVRREGGFGGVYLNRIGLTHNEATVHQDCNRSGFLNVQPKEV
jgi:hypothetical protein